MAKINKWKPKSGLSSSTKGLPIKLNKQHSKYVKHMKLTKITDLDNSVKVSKSAKITPSYIL
jgi:hypothetical protein